MEEILAMAVIAAGGFLLGAVVVVGEARTSIVKDCEKTGAFRVDDKAFICAAREAK
jgi:hypothetical protein